MARSTRSVGMLLLGIYLILAGLGLLIGLSFAYMRVLEGLLALIAGILILIVPRLLNFIVAIYLILIGLVGLFGGNFKL